MRSIEYVLGGPPVNFDDCLDYAKDNHPTGVRVRLKIRDEVSEFYKIRRLLAFFTWDFPNRSVSHEELLGGAFAHESVERQKISVANANARLEEALEKLARHGHGAEGAEARFADEALIL
jgi:hypothetical protein